MSDLPTLEDDGLMVPDVGSWAETKYRHLGIYAALFSTSMKDKWENRVYIDLFAGPGRSRIRETGRIIPASPTIAMTVPHPFTCYIFCEENHESLQVLRQRQERDSPSLCAHFVPGDCNTMIEEVLSRIPQHGKEARVLSFCFADPYRVSDLAFATLERLAERYVDFLILIPTQMDASRNWSRQIHDESETAIDRYVGTPTWREEWFRQSTGTLTFDAFFTRFFSERMKEIGYEYGGVDTTVLIRNPDRNQRLYRLGFYSKHRLGQDLWREAMKYSSGQLGLGL